MGFYLGQRLGQDLEGFYIVGLKAHMLSKACSLLDLKPSWLVLLKVTCILMTSLKYIYIYYFLLLIFSG